MEVFSDAREEAASEGSTSVDRSQAPSPTSASERAAALSEMCFAPNPNPDYEAAADFL